MLLLLRSKGKYGAMDEQDCGGSAENDKLTHYVSNNSSAYTALKVIKPECSMSAVGLI